MTQQAESTEIVYGPVTMTQAVRSRADVLYGRYRTINEVVAEELKTATSPKALIDILMRLRLRLQVRLALLPTPPQTDLQRTNRQTCEGRSRKIDEEIVAIKQTFNL